MPDLDILIEISDYYEIDLRELLDGERKSKKMNSGIEETVLKAVEYTNTETERNIKRIHLLLRAGAIFWFVSVFIEHTTLNNKEVLRVVSDFSKGAACGMIIYGIIFTSRFGHRIKAFKQRLVKRQ